MGAAKDGTMEVRNELSIAIDTVLDMRSTIEGMAASAENNMNKHIDALKKEYDDAKEVIDTMTGCSVV